MSWLIKSVTSKINFIAKKAPILKALYSELAQNFSKNLEKFGKLSGYRS